MILEVQHETCLDYTAPVSEWVTEVRMEPTNDDRQSCHSFHLLVSQPTSLFRYLDGFGNRVHHFNIFQPHTTVRVLAASVVETSSRLPDLMTSQATFPLNFESASFEVLDFLTFRGPVTQTPLLKPLLDEVNPNQGQRIGPWIYQVGEYIRSNFVYARYVTDAMSPIDDLLKFRKGVCQDFAHLMIAVLRSFNVPAKYVSGYIHRPNKDSQSHAWCEVWLPDLGWIGFDPTNGCPTNDRFVKVATGRDYTDVPPNKGIFRGQGEEKISVRVGTRELERLPSLAWHEQLQPLDVSPSEVTRHRLHVEAEEQLVLQQQQQQQ